MGDSEGNKFASYAHFHLLRRLALGYVMACRSDGESYWENAFCQAAAAKLALVTLAPALAQQNLNFRIA